MLSFRLCNKKSEAVDVKKTIERKERKNPTEQTCGWLQSFLLQDLVEIVMNYLDRNPCWDGQFEILNSLSLLKDFCPVSNWLYVSCTLEPHMKTIQDSFLNWTTDKIIKIADFMSFVEGCSSSSGLNSKMKLLLEKEIKDHQKQCDLITSLFVQISTLQSSKNLLLFKNLHYFNLHVDCQSDNFDPNSIVQLFAQNKNLTSFCIDFDENKFVNENFANSIFAILPQLSSLENLVIESLSSDSKVLLSNVAKCKNLQSLALLYFNCDISNININIPLTTLLCCPTECSIQELSQFPLLEIELKKLSRDVTNDMFPCLRFLSIDTIDEKLKLTNLEMIDVGPEKNDDNNYFTFQSISTLASFFSSSKNLITIELNHVIFQDCLEKCFLPFTLEQLLLTNCQNLELFIAAFGPSLKQSKVSYLHLKNLSSKVANQITKVLPNNLSTLVLSNIKDKKVTNEILLHIPQSVTTLNLTEISHGPCCFLKCLEKVDHLKHFSCVFKLNNRSEIDEEIDDYDWTEKESQNWTLVLLTLLSQNSLQSLDVSFKTPAQISVVDQHLISLSQQCNLHLESKTSLQNQKQQTTGTTIEPLTFLSLRRFHCVLFDSLNIYWNIRGIFQIL
jgi:hypothetical protein